MKGFQCRTCGSSKLEQLDFGVKVSVVVDVTVDDGLLCSFTGFEPSESTRVKYRCGSCKTFLDIAEKDIVNFLKFGGG